MMIPNKTEAVRTCKVRAHPPKKTEFDSLIWLSDARNKRQLQAITGRRNRVPLLVKIAARPRICTKTARHLIVFKTFVSMKYSNGDAFFSQFYLIRHILCSAQFPKRIARRYIPSGFVLCCRKPANEVLVFKIFSGISCLGSNKLLIAIELEAQLC